MMTSSTLVLSHFQRFQAMAFSACIAHRVLIQFTQHILMLPHFPWQLIILIAHIKRLSKDLASTPKHLGKTPAIMPSTTFVYPAYYCQDVPGSLPVELAWKTPRLIAAPFSAMDGCVTTPEMRWVVKEESGASFSEKKRKLANKSVRFSGTIHTVPQSTCQDSSLSRNEIRATCWYNKHDFERFRRNLWDATRTVRAVTLGLTNKKELSSMGIVVCSRGLEHILLGHQADQFRKHNRAALVRNVLARQEVHRLAGRSNPEALRAISEKMSLKSKRMAIEIGRLWDNNNTSAALSTTQLHRRSPSAA